MESTTAGQPVSPNAYQELKSEISLQLSEKVRFLVKKISEGDLLDTQVMFSGIGMAKLSLEKYFLHTRENNKKVKEARLKLKDEIQAKFDEVYDKHSEGPL